MNVIATLFDTNFKLDIVKPRLGNKEELLKAIIVAVIKSAADLAKVSVSCKEAVSGDNGKKLAKKWH